MSVERLHPDDLDELKAAVVAAIRAEVLELQNSHKTKKEVCTIKHIGPSTLNEWIADGLRVTPTGPKQVRIDLRDVDAYLEGKKR